MSTRKKELTRRFIKSLKVLEYTIQSVDFDFIGASAEIDRYCRQNDIPAKQRNRIQLCIEELVQQILIPEIDELDIHVTVEHSAKDENTVVTAAYPGNRFDPNDSDDELSLTMLKSTAAKFNYTFNKELDLSNTVKIQIK